MARIDWNKMSHDDFAEAGEAWAEERDARVKRLVNADKPTRRMRNGVEAPRGALDEGAS
jgi:hypothetical protein